MKTMIALVIGTATVLAAVSTSASKAERASAGRYQNAKYGYSVEYPTNFLAPQTESDAGDGRSFTARNGHGKVSVWASYEQGPLGDDLSSYRPRCASWPPSYLVNKPAKHLAALSCYAAGDNVIYTKILRCKDVTTQIEFDYPKSAQRLWEPVVTSMSKSLGAGCGLD